MKEKIKLLRIIYILYILLTVAFAAVVEFLLMDEAGGSVIDSQGQFIFQMVAVFLTLGGIYGALRLFKFKTVKEEIERGSVRHYFTWSLVRLALLELPALFNIVSYHLFVESSFVYLFYMVLIAFVFVFPSEQRYYNETGKTDEE